MGAQSGNRVGGGGDGGGEKGCPIFSHPPLSLSSYYPISPPPFLLTPFSPSSVVLTFSSYTNLIANKTEQSRSEDADKERE